MSPDPERLHATIHGRVQGVGFRDFVFHCGRTLGVTGVVRNLRDRSVEVIAEGPRDALEQLLAHLRGGPPVAHVEIVDVAWTEATGLYPDFRITG